MKSNRPCIWLFLLATWPGWLHAESFALAKTSFGGIGKNHGIDGMGLGGALAARTGGMAALDQNPAGLAWEDDAWALSLGHQALVQDSNLEAVQLTRNPRKGMGFGAQVEYLNQAAIERRDAHGLLLDGELRPSSLQAKMALGGRIGQKLALGASAAYLQQSISSESQRGISIGMGGQWRGSESWILALGLDGLGGGAGRNAVPREGYLGAIWGLGQPMGRLEAAGQADIAFNGVSSLGAGLQYCVGNSFWMRAGYRYALEEQTLVGLSGLDAGLGARWQAWQLDYGLAFMGDLGFQQGLSISYHVQSAPALNPVAASPPDSNPNQAMLNEARRLAALGQNGDAVRQYLAYVSKDDKNLEAWVELGKIYLLFNRPTDAQRCFQWALKVDPKNDEVKKLLIETANNLPKN